MATTRESRSQTSQSLAVVILEARTATVYLAEHPGDAPQKVDEWDPSQFLTDSDGRRLFEQVARRLRDTAVSVDVAGVALSLPGTLSGADTIVSSSRLNIHEKVDVSTLMKDHLDTECYIFHDVECLAKGEALNLSETSANAQTTVYIFIDEGVGSNILINGRPYIGAGVAGLLGRLTVQPDGSYYRALAARGSLEVFSSRPWVSENMVCLYLSERDKIDRASRPVPDNAFRRALGVAAGTDDWHGLTYSHIAEGIETSDPIAVGVLEVAARYLGFALNCVITILHPHQIILGGGMVTDLPGFSDQVIDYARRFSWPLAWNNTSIVIARMGRDAQVMGAAALCYDVLSEHNGAI